MCDDCVFCDYVNADIRYLNKLQQKYKTKTFDELMEAERQERTRSLIKLAKSVLRDIN